jgi:hypothetical protein
MAFGESLDLSVIIQDLATAGCRVLAKRVRDVPFLAIELPPGMADSPGPLDDPAANLLNKTLWLRICLQCSDTEPDMFPLLYRVVDSQRLTTIMATGVDVEPPDSPLFASMHIEKALEFGGNPKVVQAFHAARLQQTFVDVPPGVSKRELNKLKKRFPHKASGRQGVPILSNTELGYHQGSPYSYRIVGPPLEALAFIAIVSYHGVPIDSLLESALIEDWPPSPRA